MSIDDLKELFEEEETDDLWDLILLTLLLPKEPVINIYIERKK